MAPTKVPRKRTLHPLSFVADDALMREVRREAQRLDRSPSWVLQQAWKISQPRIKSIPSGT